MCKLGVRKLPWQICWTTLGLLLKRHMPLAGLIVNSRKALLVPTCDNNRQGLLLSRESQLPCMLTWFMHTTRARKKRWQLTWRTSLLSGTSKPWITQDPGWNISPVWRCHHEQCRTEQQLCPRYILICLSSPWLGNWAKLIFKFAHSLCACRWVFILSIASVATTAPGFSDHVFLRVGLGLCMPEYRCLVSVGLTVVWSNTWTPNFVPLRWHAMWLRRKLRP